MQMRNQPTETTADAIHLQILYCSCFLLLLLTCSFNSLVLENYLPTNLIILISERQKNWTSTYSNFPPTLNVGIFTSPHFSGVKSQKQRIRGIKLGLYQDIIAKNKDSFYSVLVIFRPNVQCHLQNLFLLICQESFFVPKNRRQASCGILADARTSLDMDRTLDFDRFNLGGPNTQGS